MAPKTKTKRGNSTSKKNNGVAIGILSVLLLFAYTLSGLFFYFGPREQLIDIIFLKVLYSIPAMIFIFVIFLFTETKINLIIPLLHSNTSLKGQTLDIGRGIYLAWGFFALASTSVYRSISQSTTGGFALLSSGGKHTRLSNLVPSATPLGNFFGVLEFNVLEIGGGEEILTLTVLIILIWVVSGYMGKKFNHDITKNDPTAIGIAWVGSIFFFLGLHYFVWDARNISYWLSGAIGRSIFNAAYFWQGIIVAVITHGFYDFLIEFSIRTGLGREIRNAWFLFSFVLAVILGVNEVRKG